MENIYPHKNGEFVKVHTNRGTQLSTMVVNYLRLNIPAWFNKDSRANIISLIAVMKLYRVTMDTAEEVVMYAHVSKTDIMIFVKIPNGLYCHNTDLPNYCTCKLKNNVSTYSIVNTVVSNIKLYSCREIRNTDKPENCTGKHHSHLHKDFLIYLTTTISVTSLLHQTTPRVPHIYMG